MAICRVASSAPIREERSQCFRNAFPVWLRRHIIRNRLQAVHRIFERHSDVAHPEERQIVFAIAHAVELGGAELQELQAGRESSGLVHSARKYHGAVLVQLDRGERAVNQSLRAPEFLP